MKPYRIGQVGQRAGVRVDTVRFYERDGLIPEPPRRRRWPAAAGESSTSPTSATDASSGSTLTP